MIEPIFRINDRFTVLRDKNEVLDTKEKETVRLEPRIMKLLCLLAERQGQAVSRAEIVGEIWYDYPGGDEGLSQAVSILRKIIKDDQKKIIQTLPKNGYCLSAIITAPKKVKRSGKILQIASLVFVIVIGLGLMIPQFKVMVVPSKKKFNSDSIKRKHDEDVLIYKADSAHQVQIIADRHYNANPSSSVHDTPDKTRKLDSIHQAEKGRK